MLNLAENISIDSDINTYLTKLPTLSSYLYISLSLVRYGDTVMDKEG
jgi:hypothetical protein